MKEKQKDPAFLFYTSDFLTGVQDLTMLERGQYITLLCLQHQKGHLSEKTICLCLGLTSVSLIADVLAKFIIDENGLYYNKRLEKEIINRDKYCMSRRENGKNGGRPKKTDNHMDTHMQSNNEPYAEPYENHSEDEDDNEIKDDNKDIKVIIDYLNLKAKKAFRYTESNFKFIRARLKDYSIDEIKSVVDKKCADWLGTQWEIYLRPETLFNATKFESYFNEQSKQQPAENKEIEKGRWKL